MPRGLTRFRYLLGEAVDNIKANRTTTVIALATTTFTMLGMGVFLLLYLNVQEALDATKWSSRPGTLESGRGQPYVLAVEPRLDEAVVGDLAARGHRIERVPDYTIGAHEAIIRDGESGVLMGGAAPTRDGSALGW